MHTNHQIVYWINEKVVRSHAAIHVDKMQHIGFGGLSLFHMTLLQSSFPPLRLSHSLLGGTLSNMSGELFEMNPPCEESSNTELKTF